MDTYEIRAIYDYLTIRVYQAFSPEIAIPAIEAGTFVDPFKRSRMTWIKPSFCWMMYRSDFATKHGQEVILGIDITREGFEWALQHGSLSHYHESIHGTYENWKTSSENACVRIQWDPERDISLEKIPNTRSIQIGLKGEAVDRYVDDWIVEIHDMTSVVTSMRNHLPGKTEKQGHLPHEQEHTYLNYPKFRNAFPPKK